MTVEGKGIAVRRPGARRLHRQPARRDDAPITGAEVWAQLRGRPAAERQALLRAHLGQLPAQEVARLLALSEAATRLEVLERLARRDDPPR
ncbi:MAG: hypothetical protein ACXVFL_15335 [Solirubrobacteraceae bacterium]